ncbi:MAG: hypothetical protein DSZ04_01920 [Sulfurimonas sp.]|nr:MAG: hypothetical protein DSZ04_01920 [Sulfurimonas sp.]
MDDSFIKNLSESHDSQIYVKTIQTFARRKRLKLVTQLVYYETVYKEVKELGIDFVQRYYLEEPKAAI